MAQWPPAEMAPIDEVAEPSAILGARNILTPTARNELHDEEVLAGESRKCLSLEKRLDPLVVDFSAMLDCHLVLLLTLIF